MLRIVLISRADDLVVIPIDFIIHTCRPTYEPADVIVNLCICSEHCQYQIPASAAMQLSPSARRLAYFGLDIIVNVLGACYEARIYTPITFSDRRSTSNFNVDCRTLVGKDPGQKV